MKNLLAAAFIFIVVLAIEMQPINVNAYNVEKNNDLIFNQTQSTEKVVARSPEANAVLYAVDQDGHLANFKLVVNGSVRYFPYWINVSNPSYAPKFIYNDVNGDGKKELIIVLTKGYGTGVLDSEIHVFQKIHSNIGEVYEEVLVDNPKAIILKNVKTKLTPHKAQVTVGNNKIVINIDKLKITPENMFTDVYFGNIVSFDVLNNKLIATISGQISPSGFIGNVQITYMFKDNMYQANKIDFIPSRIT